MRGGVRLKRSVHRLGLAAARRAPGTVRIPRLLSIVVPVRDAEAELDECLTSLREQDYWACEIVVVDLGLPAADAAVAARHARDDFRVRVVSSASGLATGRNRGAESVVGQFLAFVDADDAVTRHGFAMTIAALRASGSDLAVFAYAPTRRGTRSLSPSVCRRCTAPAASALRRHLPRSAGQHDGVPASSAAAPTTTAAGPLPSSRAPMTPTASTPLLGVRRRRPHPRRTPRREESDRSPLTRRTTDPEGLRSFGAGVDAAAALLPDRLSAVYAAEVLAGPAGRSSTGPGVAPTSTGPPCARPSSASAPAPPTSRVGGCRRTARS